MRNRSNRREVTTQAEEVPLNPIGNAFQTPLTESGEHVYEMITDRKVITNALQFQNCNVVHRSKRMTQDIQSSTQHQSTQTMMCQQEVQSTRHRSSAVMMFLKDTQQQIQEQTWMLHLKQKQVENMWTWHNKLKTCNIGLTFVSKCPMGIHIYLCKFNYNICTVQYNIYISRHTQILSF